MGQLMDLGAEVADIASRVADSVVRIGRDRGRGAGVVIAEGRVATNAHNLRGEQVTVSFGDGHSETGRVVGVDIDADLAVIAVDTRGAPALEWGNGELPLGTPVFAVTNPPGGGARVTFGLVSATGQAFRGPQSRRITDAVEHTAPLARGSSGSPLVDAQGRLAGINTHRRGDGFYLAVPATPELRERLEALGRGEAPHRVRLGVAVAPAHVARRLRGAVGLPPRDGLLVRGVEEDGPAARAGVRPGDLIVEAAGQPVTSGDELHALLDGLEPGASLVLRLVRGADELDVAVTFTGAQEEGSA
ncbi:MAG: S1C family serine protease [Egibacteraceae bacterium]